MEKAIQFAIEDLSTVSSVLDKLKGRKTSDFIDTTILKELIKEGFFAQIKR